MLEILVILAILIGMAKRRGTPRRKRAFNLRRVRIASSPAIGALATEDLTVVAISSAVTDPLRVISFNATYMWVDSNAEIDGGLEFGLAHSDYDAAEIEECLEVAASMDLGDKIAQEQANRLVRRIGVIRGARVSAGEDVFNDGRPVKTKLNWMLSSGDTLNVWIRNGSGVVWTTGSSLAVLGDLWVKDR